MFHIRLVLVLALIFPSAALASRHEIQVPLDDGKLSTADLSRTLAADLNLPPSILSGLDASVDLRGVSGWMIVRGLNRALGDAFQLSVKENALIVEVDPEKLPGDWNGTSLAVRRFTEIAAPNATARHNRRLGLLMPRVIDPAKPLVIVIHGLDGDAADCADLRGCLMADGRQAATFAYPGEQPIADSAKLLALNIQALRETFSTLKIDFVTESMGGLVARQFVEGPQYSGGVDHLILIAPPNNGSKWSGYSVFEKFRANYCDWQSDKDWSPSWFITQGLGEAGGDLRPGSEFLRRLNALPRRADVKYTIIAGDHPVQKRFEADAIECAVNLVPSRISGWWGVRQARAALEQKAERVRNRNASNDGPVTVDQAKLDGVDDFVELPADHLALYRATKGQPPAAWDVVRDRLDR